MNRSLLWDALGLAGLAFVTVGLWTIYAPLGYIGLGLVLIGLAILGARKWVS